MFIGRTDTEAETPILWPAHAELTHWKRSSCWEGLGAGGEGYDRGWDSWVASPTRWAWVWVNSRSLWWTGRPGLLWFMGLQRVGHNERLNWTELNYYTCACVLSHFSCLTLCNSMDCSPSGSSVLGILQARILEWVAMPFSGDVPNQGIEPMSSMSPTLAVRFFTTNTTWDEYCNYVNIYSVNTIVSWLVNRK